MEDNKDLSTIQENSESKENSIQITETLTAEDLKKVNILLLSTKRNIITSLYLVNHFLKLLDFLYLYCL